jgi:hypothetical protein
MIKEEKQVDKKPLVGISILVVVLFILGSLSNVVGYQSAKSTVNNSPLFQTRTQRAINQQKNTLSSQYIGMEKQNLINFPMRDNGTEQLRKAIDIINKMDEKTFHRFSVKMKNLLSQQEKTKNIDVNEIEQALHQLRKNSEVFQSQTAFDSKIQTLFDPPTVCWIPGCILGGLLILLMLIFIIVFIPTELVQCYFPSIDVCQ